MSRQEPTCDQAMFQRNVYQSTAVRYRDERDAARNDLATAHRENARLRAENAVFRRVVAEAIEHALNLPDPDEETR